MSDLRELYQSVILDHNKAPRNLRRPADANRAAQILADLAPVRRRRQSEATQLFMARFRRATTGP